MKYSIILLILSSNLLFAQEKSVVFFENSSYDFGTIKEEEGPVTYEFEFTNTGNDTLIISNVKPSCGCTTSGWTKEPVMPGEKGIITAQYNPTNRPGVFKKSLTVTFNTEENVFRLYINGKVMPRIKFKSIKEELPVKTGMLRYKHNYINVGKITTEKIVIKTIEVYNEGENTLTFKDSILAPDFIKISFEPLVLNAKEKGKLIISYNPIHENNLGINSHNVKFYTDEAVDNEKELHIMATIIEYFKPLSDNEKAVAPKLQIENRLHDFGKLNQGKIVEQEFKLTNTGKNLLNIRSIKSNCKCAVATLEKENLEPGKSAILKVTLDTKGRVGSQLKSITIFSNDPSDPTQVVSVRTRVVVNK